MVPNDIITNVRRFTKVNTSQYPDSDAYKDLNNVKDEIYNALVNS
jgi:hypothetical protein